MSASTIAAAVAEMHAAMAAQPPNAAMTAFAREQAELAAAGQPPGVAPLGTQLEDAELLDMDGAPTTLYAATGTGASVVVFYRGAWCPYCNLTLSTYQQHLLPQLAGRGTPLVAISPQTPDGSLSMQQKHELAFTVLSDPGNTIAHSLGIVTQPSEQVRAAQLQLSLDLSTVNADGTIGLPMPTVVVLDAEHAIRWIDVHLNYSTRTEPHQILDAIEQLSL